MIFVEQTPAPILFLTSADTEIQTLAAALPALPEDFPRIRAVNLLQLQQPLSIDDYGEKVLAQGQVIILRLLGGRSYWAYGLEVVKEIVATTGAMLLVLPGDDRPDPELISHSTAPLAVVNQFWQYLMEGGIANFAQGLQWLSNQALGTSYPVLEPQPVPRLGIWGGSPPAPLNKGGEGVNPLEKGVGTAG
ncbi:MAG: cobaltochelatase subunit CobN, partial [Spirulina sp. DLM2.Bin59]